MNRSVPQHERSTRRRWLGMAVSFGLATRWPQPARAHDRFGPARPALPAPSLPMTGTDGRLRTLPELLSGRITALQLMFTGCSATCPIQGAIFAATQQELAHDEAGFRLLSISIDPLGDDAKALRGWLLRHGAEDHRWTAALPSVEGVERLLDFLRGRADGPDAHTAQVYLFDRGGRLAYRTIELPSAATVASTMRQLARQT